MRPTSSHVVFTETVIHVIFFLLCVTLCSGLSLLTVYESSSQELWVFLMYANTEVVQDNAASYTFFIILIFLLSWLVEVRCSLLVLEVLGFSCLHPWKGEFQ